MIPLVEILALHPGLTNLRDPPNLVGKRLRSVLVFRSSHKDNAAVEIRGLAYTVPGLHFTDDSDKETSEALGMSAFSTAKADFKSGDPGDMRVTEEMTAALECISNGLPPSLFFHFLPFARFVDSPFVKFPAYSRVGTPPLLCTCAIDSRICRYEYTLRSFILLFQYASI